MFAHVFLSSCDNTQEYEFAFFLFSLSNCFFTREEFSLKLTLLSNQWQGVIRRAQQRRGIIDSQIRQWQRYREMSEKLRKWLAEVSHLPLSGLGNIPVPLQQVRTLFDEVQVRCKHRSGPCTSSTGPCASLLCRSTVFDLGLSAS